MTLYLIVSIIAFVVGLAISYFIIYYAVKSANNEVRDQIQLTNQFLMTIMRKMEINKDEIDESIYYIFPEEEEEPASQNGG